MEIMGPQVLTDSISETELVTGDEKVEEKRLVK